MTGPRARLTVTAAALTATLSAGCGDAGTGALSQAGSAPAAATPAMSRQAGIPSPPSSQEDRMKLRISIGSQPFSATLADSAAARDLIAQLPLRVEMADHGGVEKTGPLPSPLSLQGQPEGADPDPGDVGYYAPGNDLVLYYGDQSYYRGIVVLGRLDGDAAARIAELPGSVTAVVEMP